MGPKNLGTVFGPTLMRAGEDKVCYSALFSSYVLNSIKQGSNGLPNGCAAPIAPG